MSMTFTHDTKAQRVTFGAGIATSVAAAEVSRLGARRVLLIATESSRELAGMLADALPTVETIIGVTQHVPIDDADRARDLARRNDADLAVAVGGGSAVGLAKAVAATEKIGILAIPTTYAGSEATSIWAQTVDGRKHVSLDDHVLPASVIYDADLVSTLPPELATMSALNAVAHCVDSMWASGVTPIARALAMEGLGALATALPSLRTADAEIRGACQYGGYLAAVSYASIGKALHHELVHVVAGAYSLPHARVHAIVLPYVLAVNGPAVPELTRRIAASLNPDGDDATDAVEAAIAVLLSFRDGVGGPWNLRDLGAPESIAELVDDVLAVVPDANPVRLDSDLVERILLAAWRGDDPRVLLSAREHSADTRPAYTPAIS